ncbi:hypothetical protein DL765_004082 [Monosporascus sp. GIB2]|nr:hypothetical protein DL765_004082 [Monosporascus sp. GIB2]
MIASYIGENKIFETMYLSGEMELELTPQGTLAERGAGRHRAGVDIPAAYNPPKDVKVFDGKPYLLEHSIAGDYAFIKAYRADKLGNCQFRLSAHNFNGTMGRNAKVTVVEAEHIVEPGEIPPESIHLPGIYVKRVIQSTAEKGIEKRVFARSPGDGETAKGDAAVRRERIVRREAKEFKNGMYVNLGIEMPMLAPNFLSSDVHVQLQGENSILGMGSYPHQGEEDADLVNAGKETVTLQPGASVFGSEESFGMIRSGKFDLTILGAFQVSARGDLASWMLPGKVKGFGGAMGLAVFDIDFTHGLTLVELADGVSVNEVKDETRAPLRVSSDLKPML